MRGSRASCMKFLAFEASRLPSSDHLERKGFETNILLPLALLERSCESLYLPTVRTSMFLLAAVSIVL